MRTLGTSSQSHDKPHPCFKNEIDAVLSQGELQGLWRTPAPPASPTRPVTKEGEPRLLAPEPAGRLKTPSLRRFVIEFGSWTVLFSFLFAMLEVL